jgi:hypothetical protein
LKKILNKSIRKHKITRSQRKKPNICQNNQNENKILKTIKTCKVKCEAPLLYSTSLQIKTQPKINLQKSYRLKNKKNILNPKQETSKNNKSSIYEDILNSKREREGFIKTRGKSEGGSKSMAKSLFNASIQKDCNNTSVELTQKLERMSLKCPEKYSQFKIALLKANYFYRNLQYVDAHKNAKLALGNFVIFF